MAEQRITQQVLNTVIENAEAKARLTQAQFLSIASNANTKAALSQIVWLSIVPKISPTCARPWTIPTPGPFPVPSVSGIQYSYFDELEPDWGQFGQQFPDLAPAFNTIQSARIRRFIFEWIGLDQSQAATLDAHWESTRGGLPFTLTRPRTAEVITGVRYESYERSPHRRKWNQTRTARLVKYTN